MKKTSLLLFFVLFLSACSHITHEGKEERDPNKRYIVEDPEKCKTAFINCSGGRKHFSDKYGCGCIEMTGNELEPKIDGICSLEYAPVCAKVEVQCVTTPCDPVEQTFSNKCEAKKVGAIDIKEGECS